MSKGVPAWTKRFAELHTAAVRAKVRAVRLTKAAVTVAVNARCPWRPQAGGWQCTDDKGHKGDHRFVREHLPPGVES